MGIPSATSQMLEAQGMAAQMKRRMESHNNHVAATREQQIKQHYELEIKRLQSDYRWQTENVEAVKGTAGNSVAQTQVAIDIIMESTGKSFEQVKQMILKHRNIDSYSDRAKAWLKTSPEFEGSLMSNSRQAISESFVNK